MHSSKERNCLDGGIGRRARLKIVCPRACGFDSHSGYRERLLRKPFFYSQKSHPAGSSAPLSSIADCHHNVLCHQLRCHQSQIVITTCCVISSAVINLRLSSQRVVSSAPLSSISDCHHNVLCHRKAFFNFIENIS